MPNRGRSHASPEPTTGADAQDQPTLRADAERNRERIVTAAQEVFAEWGLNAALEKIARRAGVGIATLYRRFPSMDNPDPWTGFCWLINKICAMQAADAGLKDLIAMRVPASSAVDELRNRALQSLEHLIQRAQRQGTLRSDFVSADVPMLLFANAGIVTATRDEAPDTWRRFTAYMIDAFRADSSSSPGGSAPSREQHQARVRGPERAAQPA